MDSSAQNFAWNEYEISFISVTHLATFNQKYVTKFP